MKFQRGVVMRNSLLITALFLTGCSYNTQMLMQGQNVMKYEKPCGMGHGMASERSLFGISLGDDSNLLSRALEDAKKNSCGDTMMNVFVDRSMTYIPFIFLPIFVERTVSLEGTMVKYVDEDRTPLIQPAPPPQPSRADKSKLILSLQQIKLGSKVRVYLEDGTMKSGEFGGFEPNNYKAFLLEDADGNKKKYLIENVFAVSLVQ
jgi:hypothetical protein